MGTQRYLQGHSKGTWALEHLRQSGTLKGHLETRGTQGTWVLGHSKGTWTLKGNSKGTLRSLDEHFGSRALEGHLGTRALEALGHYQRTLGNSGTQGIWVLGHSKGTWTLRNSGVGAVGYSRHSRYFI